MKRLAVVLVFGWMIFVVGASPTKSPCVICKKPFVVDDFTMGYVTLAGIKDVHARHAFQKYDEVKAKQLEALYQKVKK